MLGAKGACASGERGENGGSASVVVGPRIHGMFSW